MNRKKILIIGHNPISKGDNMGKTMRNIFQSYDKSELCQIYLRHGEPDFDICDQYFYFDEVGILKSLFNRKKPTGYVYKEENNCPHDSNAQESTQDVNSIKSKVYQFGRKRTEGVYLMRNLLWMLGKWDSPELEAWLEEQKPTCIFFFSGDYFFLLRIVMKLADKLNIPLFVYHLDEHCFNKKLHQKVGLDARIYMKYFKKMYDKAKMTFCISEIMKDDYQNFFKKKTDILMNTCDAYMEERDNNSNEFTMSYFGNLSYHRWEMISLISSAVKKLNELYERQITFNVYSGEKNKIILDPFLANPDVNFKGEISFEEVKLKMAESDILVHVESFDKESKESVKHSISTKIPEMLASNRIILAAGPKDVAAINYLQKHDAGIVINSDKLDVIVEKMKCLYEENDFSKYKDNAKNLYYANHTPVKIKEKIDSYIEC